MGDVSIVEYEEEERNIEEKFPDGSDTERVTLDENKITSLEVQIGAVDKVSRRKRSRYTVNSIQV